MRAGLLDDARGDGALLAGFLGVGVGPLEHLMATPVRHNETSHSTLLCHRWQPGRGPHAVPAPTVGVAPRLRRLHARVKRGPHWPRAIQFSNAIPMRASACAGWAANRRQAAAMLLWP